MIEVAVRTYDSVALLPAWIQRAALVVLHRVRLDELPEGRELHKWVLRRFAAARVDEDDDRGVDLGVDERLLAIPVVLHDAEGCKIQPCTSETRRWRRPRGNSVTVSVSVCCECRWKSLDFA